jgi:hypothetical protein
MSSHRLMSGRRASRSAGRDVMNTQPWRFSAHCVAVQKPLPSASVGSKRKAVRNHIERAKYARSLLRRFRIDERGELCVLDAPVDFFRVRHPINQILWRRQIVEQVSKDLLRTLDEELDGAAWLERETANALASAFRFSSADGLQYGHRSSRGLSTTSPRSGE